MARQNLKMFCSEIQKTYGPTYLQETNEEDLELILRENAEIGFPGFLGSLVGGELFWELDLELVTKVFFSADIPKILDEILGQSVVNGRRLHFNHANLLVT